MREQNPTSRKLLWITPTWGGSPVWRLGDLREVAAELIERGHDLTILAARAAEDAPFPERTRVMSEHPVRPESRRLARFARWARQQINASADATSISLTPLVAADIMMPTEGLCRITRNRRGQHLSSPKQQMVHLLDKLSPWQRQIKATEAAALNKQNTSQLIALNQDIWQQIANAPHGPATPTATFAPPLDTETISEKTASQTEALLRSAYAIPNDHQTILFASMRPDEDQLPLVLSAFGRCLKSHPNLTLFLATWVGYRLNESIANRGFRSGVRLIGIPSRLPEIIAATDLVIHPGTDPASDTILPLCLTQANRLLTTTTAADAYSLDPMGQAALALPTQAATDDWTRAISQLLETTPATPATGTSNPTLQTLQAFTTRLEAQIHFKK